MYACADVLYCLADLNMDKQEVIDHTHGRRVSAVSSRAGGVLPQAEADARDRCQATDNLRDLKPELADTPDKDMAPHVQEFEEKILASADEFQKEVRSRRESMAEEIVRC